MNNIYNVNELVGKYAYKLCTVRKYSANPGQVWSGDHYEVVVTANGYATIKVADSSRVSYVLDSIQGEINISPEEITLPGSEIRRVRHEAVHGDSDRVARAAKRLGCRYIYVPAGIPPLVAGWENPTIVRLADNHWVVCGQAVPTGAALLKAINEEPETPVLNVR